MSIYLPDAHTTDDVLLAAAVVLQNSTNPHAATTVLVDLLLQLLPGDSDRQAVNRVLFDRQQRLQDDQRRAQERELRWHKST